MAALVVVYGWQMNLGGGDAVGGDGCTDVIIGGQFVIAVVVVVEL